MSRRWPKGTRNPDRCRHRWEPITLEVDHTEWREDGTTFEVGQPHLEEAKAYLVCLRCASWTYMCLAWAGVQLEGSQSRAPGQWEDTTRRDMLARLRDGS